MQRLFGLQELHWPTFDFPIAITLPSVPIVGELDLIPQFAADEGCFPELPLAECVAMICGLFGASPTIRAPETCDSNHRLSGSNVRAIDNSRESGERLLDADLSREVDRF